MGMENDPDIRGRAPTARASAADRARARELLRRHHRDGRLTTEELAQRTDRVNAATTFGELDAILANLPRLPPPPVVAPTATAPGAARRAFFRALFAYVVINLF